MPGIEIVSMNGPFPLPPSVPLLYRIFGLPYSYIDPQYNVPLINGIYTSFYNTQGKLEMRLFKMTLNGVPIDRG